MLFPAVWLRDNCPCSECVAPGTGQKLRDITEMPNGLGITQTQHAPDSVAVTFAPDQHRSVFSRAWLAGHALDHHDDSGGRTEDGKQLWVPAGLDAVPETSWPRYLAKDRAAARAAVLRLGFVLMHDVPAEPGMVLEVAASFGFVRETNYGRLLDVRVEPAPGNLAFTSRAIALHTDNPYRDPVPTLQLLHCLRTAAKEKGDAETGGDTGLVDGLRRRGRVPRRRSGTLRGDRENTRPGRPPNRSAPCPCRVARWAPMRRPRSGPSPTRRTRWRCAAGTTRPRIPRSRRRSSPLPAAARRPDPARPA